MLNFGSSEDEGDDDEGDEEGEGESESDNSASPTTDFHAIMAKLVERLGPERILQFFQALQEARNVRSASG